MFEQIVVSYVQINEMLYLPGFLLAFILAHFPGIKGRVEILWESNNIITAVAGIVQAFLILSVFFGSAVYYDSHIISPMTLIPFYLREHVQIIFSQFFWFKKIRRKFFYSAILCFIIVVSKFFLQEPRRYYSIDVDHEYLLAGIAYLVSLLILGYFISTTKSKMNIIVEE
ncbi:MAG TPA: hypothetical protein VE978_00285 [Chitinophagales bacterium]|nr:hypothetical protein [Chitinophagales bacterium]